jgi:hypothetical protein
LTILSDGCILSIRFIERPKLNVLIESALWAIYFETLPQNWLSKILPKRKAECSIIFYLFQGFQKHFICEIWPNRTKVMNFWFWSYTCKLSTKITEAYTRLQVQNWYYIHVKRGFKVQLTNETWGCAQLLRAMSTRRSHQGDAGDDSIGNPGRSLRR